MDFIMAVVKTIRSLRSDYKLTKTAADCKSAEKRRFATRGKQHALKYAR